MRTGRYVPEALTTDLCYTAPAEDGRLSLRESTVFRGAKDDDDVTKPTGGSIVFVILGGRGSRRAENRLSAPARQEPRPPRILQL